MQVVAGGVVSNLLHSVLTIVLAAALIIICDDRAVSRQQELT